MSDTLDLAIHQFDVDSNRTMFIDKVIVSNLAMPEISKNLTEELESFNVYIKIIPYKSGLSVDAMEFSQNYRINQKYDSNNNVLTTGETGNVYEIINEPVDRIISYENDVAPIAKTASYIGGVTMLGNLSTPISFPYDFKYFHAITITNQNTEGFVDSVICLEINEKI